MGGQAALPAQLVCIARLEPAHVEHLAELLGVLDNHRLVLGIAHSLQA